MYKNQMIFQKIICFVMLAASALVFVYSLGLMTDLYDSLYLTMMDPENIEDTTVRGSRIYYDMQGFNGELTKAGIGLILVSLFLFITNTHSRRKYYVGNIISTVLSVVASFGVSFWALTNISDYKNQYLQIDFEALKEHSELWNTYYTDSTFWFDAGTVVFAVLMVSAVLLVFNYVLKIMVMKEEKRLISEGKGVKA